MQQQQYPHHRSAQTGAPGGGTGVSSQGRNEGRVLPAGFAGALGAARTGLLRRVKRADQTVNNSTVLVTATDLTFPVRANELWAVEALLRYDAHASPDIVIAVALPSGATFEGWAIGFDSTVSASIREMVANTGLVFAGLGISSPRTLIIRGIAAIGSTQGSCEIQFAQNSAVSQDTTLRAKSLLLAERVSLS